MPTRHFGSSSMQPVLQIFLLQDPEQSFQRNKYHLPNNISTQYLLLPRHLSPYPGWSCHSHANSQNQMFPVSLAPVWTVLDSPGLVSLGLVSLDRFYLPLMSEESLPHWLRMPRYLYQPWLSHRNDTPFQALIRQILVNPAILPDPGNTPADSLLKSLSHPQRKLVLSE